MIDVPAAFSTAMQTLPLGLGLRRASADDEVFLRTLYVDHRMIEWAEVPWPAESKRAFLDTQYDFQQRHYSTRYPQAWVLVVTRGERNIGRLYLYPTTDALHVVDILLDARERGNGVGSALLCWMQEAVRLSSRIRLTLSVELQNQAARRLYERHGFVAGPSEGAHIPMTWHSPARVSAY